MRSSVDLPQPDGPTMVTNSPGVDGERHVVDRPACRRGTSSRCASNAMPVASMVVPDGECRGMRSPPDPDVLARLWHPRPLAYPPIEVTAAAGVPGIASFHCASADLARPPRARGHRRSPPGHGGGGRGRAAHLVDRQRPRRAAGLAAAVPAAGPAVVRLRRPGQRDLRVRAGEQPADRPGAGAAAGDRRVPRRRGPRVLPARRRQRPQPRAGHAVQLRLGLARSRAPRRSPCRWSRTTSSPGWSATAATSCCRSTTP